MALNLVERLGDSVTFYKVGWRLFLQGGMALVDEIRNQGKDVFLDLKMDDIEETIEMAVRDVADKAMFLTIHGNGATARAGLVALDVLDAPLSRVPPSSICLREPSMLSARFAMEAVCRSAFERQRAV